MYSIYENIPNEKFIEIKTRLDKLERFVSPTMQQFGFYQNRDAQYNDVLGLDYLKRDAEVKGNIGLAIVDENIVDDPKFTFYVLKSYDNEKTRFFKKIEIDSFFSLEEIEKNYRPILQECISAYDRIAKEEMTEMINLKSY